MSIKKIVIPTALAGSLVASLAALGSAGPASAGSGASQSISAVLRLATPTISNAIRTCEDIDFEDESVEDTMKCNDENLVSPIDVHTLTLGLAYEYKPGQVESVPDVATQSGKLKNLPLTADGHTNPCEGRPGAAIHATGAAILSGGYSTSVNDGTTTTPGPSASPGSRYASPVKSVHIIKCLNEVRVG